MAHSDNNKHPGNDLESIMKAIKRLISAWQQQLAKFESVGLSDKRIELVQQKLKPVLSGIFGYHSLLYSKKANSLVCGNIIVRHSTVISGRIDGGDLVCQYEELPIASDCIDLVVLPEILQQSQTPHQILREVERVLIPEGHIILLIANPVSGLAIKNRFIRFLTRQKNRPKVIGRLRVNDWFRLLGFEVTSEIPVCMADQKIQKESRYSWLKKISQFSCEYFAGYYIIVAKKKVSTMTPIRPSWRSNKKLVGSRIAEPSVKAHVENCVKQIMR